MSTGPLREKPRIVVFTDLDGSLLDSATYSFEAAKVALQALQALHIPLVLTSSKTRAEMEPIRFRLDHREPFIVENGGGVYVPKGQFDFPLMGAMLRGAYQVIDLGVPYTKVRAALKEIAQGLSATVRGFGDMTVDEIAERTGLSPGEALLARQREYDEPFLIEGSASPPEEVTRQAEDRGLRYTAGGRFFHLMGKSDKGQACRYLIECYRRQRAAKGEGFLTVGVGDSLNDLPMLAVVDRPILVQKPDGSYDPRIVLPNLTHASGIGPVGWNQAILDLLRTA